jgi:hypothetical protein
MLIICLIALALPAGCTKKDAVQGNGGTLSDAQVENIVRRSYQYVAVYNVIQKSALDPANPMSTRGFNRMSVATRLYDHTVRSIARPNNDTLYITGMLDLRKEPVLWDIPKIDSRYISLMAVAYDHYVNVPLTTRKGDLGKPEKILFYSARTKGYKGEPVEGVDHVFEMSGDFVITALRVMPHASEPERFRRIVQQMQSTKLQTLAEYRGGKAGPIDDITFPAFDKTDADIFGTNLLEVMQFVFNHTTFDPNDEIDRGVLDAYKPLGVEPGKAYDASRVARIDGDRFRRASQEVQRSTLALMADPANMREFGPRMLRPKGKTDLDALVLVSVIGPIGLPMEEAAYPSVGTVDGKPMNAMNDYVIRMNKDDLPPAGSFWSLTLYDLKNGFFIPNDRKKYSVGLNGGMKLDKDGGIEIYVAADPPKGVPEENWLPISRKDENVDIILRIYVPDLEKMKTWTPPKAEMLTYK